MKKAFAVKSFTMTMMAVLLLFAMILCGGGAKAADNEAKTIEIHPGDECLTIYDDYYTMNDGERQDWTGDYMLTGANFNDQGEYSAFKVIVEDGYNMKDDTKSITLNNLSILNTTDSETCALYIWKNARVNLLLEGQNQLLSGNYQPGIQTSLEENGALTIEGNGSLFVQGGKYAAGIGGGAYRVGKNITINSGTVTAAGGSETSGISSFEKDGSTAAGTSWMITGAGTENSDAPYCGAGIGGGTNADGRNITINGGTVTAHGADGASGIGGGNNGFGESITINNGLVRAEGGSNAAGIGAGSLCCAHNIAINGGTVTAVGQGSADDIGQGAKCSVDGNGPFQVTGGTINADMTGNETTGIYNNMIQTGTALTHYTFNLKDPSGNAVSCSQVQSLTVGSCTGIQEPAGQNNDSQYSIQGMQTNEDGQLTFYMNSNYIPFGSNVTVVVNNAAYVGSITGSVTDLTSPGVITLQDGSRLTIWNDGYYLGTDTDPSESQKISYTGGYSLNSEGRTDCGVTVKNGASDKNITINDLDIDSETPFVIENAASVNLTVAGTNTFRAGEGKAGLQISEDGSVVINGTGSLRAVGGNCGAGIGGTEAMTAGNITINSGDITAVGGSDAAGIGGGSQGGVTRIVLNGGTVSAVGGEAGIGLGRNASLKGKIIVGSDVTLGSITGARYAVTPLTNNVYQQSVPKLNASETAPAESAESADTAA